MDNPDDIHKDGANSDNISVTESPVVQGGQDPFSEDTQEESVDITDEMGKIGKDIDPEHPEPLGED